MSLHKHFWKISLASVIALTTLNGAIAQDAKTSNTPAPTSSAKPAKKHISLIQRYDRWKEKRAFRHLSNDGQQAFYNLLTAQQYIADNKATDATASLKKAQKYLKAASRADGKFIAAESALHPSTKHQAADNHTVKEGKTTWIPVYSEFIESEDISVSPEKKSSVQQANNLLKQGKNQQAIETLQLVDEDIDYIIALAPLDIFNKEINAAQTSLKNNNSAQANDHIKNILSSLVFVDDDLYKTNTKAPASSAAPKVAKKADAPQKK